MIRKGEFIPAERIEVIQYRDYTDMKWCYGRVDIRTHHTAAAGRQLLSLLPGELLILVDVLKHITRDIGPRDREILMEDL